MATKTVCVPQKAFFGDTDLELTFPMSWDVGVHSMPSHDWPPLSDDEIRAALAHPIGKPPLRELARGRHEAVIIFDDMSRPTPTSRIWPFVVEELHAAGLADQQIRFIVAAGLHGAHSREDFVRKLGEEALRRFPVYNHNPYEHCTYVGTTSQGTPVEVNSEVLACDLRIGIGSIVPHPFAGFGGGPKIVLPGIASIRTIQSNHGPLKSRLSEEGRDDTFCPGYAGNLVCQDFSEAAELAGLDFKVDAIVNERRGVVRLFAGQAEQEWREGAKVAKGAYATMAALDAQVVVANGYGKGNEAFIGAGARYIGHGHEKDLVSIATCPQGQVVHYLFGDFGAHALGNLNTKGQDLPPGIRRLIIFTPYPEKSAEHFYTTTGQVFRATTWDEVMCLLNEWHPKGARIAIYPDLTIQYLELPPGRS